MKLLSFTLLFMIVSCPCSMRAAERNSADTCIFHREKSHRVKYYVSNTTSEEEDNDPTKHIALLLKGVKDSVFDGHGRTFLMDGEMTSFVVDSCENLTLRNFTIDFIAPTQTEMTVMEVGDDYFTARIHPTSHYRIIDRKNPKKKFLKTGNAIEWHGKGWSFNRGIAQLCDTTANITWRTWCPMNNINVVEEIEKGVLKFSYATSLPITLKEGWVFQMRDAIRDEVCGLIQHSKNIALENVNIHYAGNFGIVSQYTDGVSFRHVNFEPQQNSGRTNTGFADFLQISGCKGKVEIENCRFVGAHDDPINIHGTHLQVVAQTGAKHLRIRFAHPQTYGLRAFEKGDSIALVNSYSLLHEAVSTVKNVEIVSSREMIIETETPLPTVNTADGAYCVDNLTWQPEVSIANNYFARIPTRGILVTTRKPVVIENNYFHRMQMSAILIANDARSWFESGPVSDVNITNNHFIECGEPVIYIAPENSIDVSPVHGKVVISNNFFKLKRCVPLSHRSTRQVTFTDNTFLQ